MNNDQYIHKKVDASITFEIVPSLRLVLEQTPCCNFFLPARRKKLKAAVMFGGILFQIFEHQNGQRSLKIVFREKEKVYILETILTLEVRLYFQHFAFGNFKPQVCREGLSEYYLITPTTKNLLNRSMNFLEEKCKRLCVDRIFEIRS